MTNTIKKCWMYWGFSFVLICSQKSIAQNLSTTAKIADSLFLHEQYDESIDLYKRILFFDKNEIYDSLVFARLSASYFLLGKYEQASKYFNHSYSATSDYNFLFDQILCQILAGNYKLAKLTLFNITDQTPEIAAKKMGLLSLVEFKLKNFDASDMYFSKFRKVSFASYSEQQSIEIAHRAQRIQKKYKKSKVKLMSLLLPGLGQAYCGDVKDGVNSLGITTLFGGIYFRVANTLGILDAIIVVLPWYQRYYIGGYKKAGQLAEQKQQVLFDAIFNEMVQIMQESSYFKK